MKRHNLRRKFEEDFLASVRDSFPNTYRYMEASFRHYDRPEVRFVNISHYQSLYQRFGEGYWDEVERELTLGLGAGGQSPDCFARIVSLQYLLSEDATDFDQIHKEIYEDDIYPLAEHVWSMFFPPSVWRSRVIRELVKGQPGGPGAFCDLGFGPGTTSRDVLSLHPQWTATGWDVSRRCQEYARNLLKICGYQDRCDLRIGDVRELDVPDDSFDFAIAAEVFEHIPDPSDGLRELARVLRPTGRAIVSMPVGMPLAMHLFEAGSRDQLLEVIRKNGFKIERLEEQSLGGTGTDVCCLLSHSGA